MARITLLLVQLANFAVDEALESNCQTRVVEVLSAKSASSPLEC
jgi:hypothetical protein